MRIFAAGLATETNTFSPIPTGLEDFCVWRPRDVGADDVKPTTVDLDQLWGELARLRGYEFAASLSASAEPSGLTVQSVYEALRDEVLDDLKAALPVDVVLLILHGAMVAQGYDDCEVDLLRRVRAIVGSQTVIGVELDLHCHLTPDKIEAADILITYKEYPHLDINDRARELFELSVATRLGNVRPTAALFDCRMVGLYPTSSAPMQGFVDLMIATERRSGVLSISFGHGFQFADLPHVGAKMLVVTDDDPALAQKLARELGLAVYGLRSQIGLESQSLPMEEALSSALASSRMPVVVADQSDNPGGGAPADATYVLHWLLDHGIENAAMAIFHDPQVVRIAMKAGLGARLPIRLGGKTSPSSGNPVDLEVTVLAIRTRYTHALEQRSGDAVSFPAGDIVAIRSRGIDIIVSSERCQCFNPQIFTDLGIDPRAKRLLVPKSTQHFYAAFASLGGEIIYMSAPGALAPDPRHNHYTRLDTQGLYPWHPDPLGCGAFR